MIIPKRVLAQAIVDPLRSPFGLRIIGKEWWRVTVRGAGAHAGHLRAYDIVAKSDGDAAQEGIDKFVDEMQRLSV